MSNFNTAVLTVLKHEGGYVNDPQDTGGATNHGISLRFLKAVGDLDNNGFLDGDFDLDGHVDVHDISKMTQDDAINIYRHHWWDKYQYDRIINQSIATKVFDLAVNMGAKQAHICLQRAVRSACGVELLEDGVLGIKSIAAINNAPQSELLAAFRSEAASFYRSLNRPRYLNGWLKRAYNGS